MLCNAWLLCHAADFTHSRWQQDVICLACIDNYQYTDHRCITSWTGCEWNPCSLTLPGQAADVAKSGPQRHIQPISISSASDPT